MTRLASTVVFLGLLLFVACRQQSANKPNYSSLSSEQLINFLASPVPPLNTNGHLPVLEESALLRRQSSLQPNFGPARSELAKRGRIAWDDLARHLDDNRYSTSSNDAGWANWTVGDVCFALIADEVETYCKHLKLGKLTPYYVSQEITRAKLPAWVNAHKNKTLNDLRMEAADWALARAKAIVAERGMRPEALDDLIRYRNQLAQ